MRWAVFIGCLASGLGCKPADEPSRRPRAPTVAAAPGLDLGAPPSPADDARAGAPPTVAAVARLEGEAPVADEGARGAGPEGAGARDDADAAEAAPEAPDTIEAADTIATAGGPDATPANDDAVLEDAGGAADAAADDDGAAPDGLEAVIATLSREASSAEQDKARALNKSGLEKHKKKAYDQAAADYRAALEAWPAHPFSRYNLACALALMGQADRALFELEVLGHMAQATTAARDRLRAARVDNDFVSLREHARFRELTGATDILVAWTRDEDKALAKRLAELLRNARWGGKAATRAWNAIEGLPARPTVVYRADDPIARKVVEEVAGALSTELPDVSAEPAGALPPEAPPIVVWLPPPAAPPETPGPDGQDGPSPTPDTPAPDTPAPDDPAPEAPAPEAPGELDEVRDFIGLALSGPGPERESLELKPTGFFVWQVAPAIGRRGVTTSRTGRWQLRGGTFVLSYKETTSTPADGGEPRLDVREGQSASLAVAVPRPGVIVIEGRSFRGAR